MPTELGWGGEGEEDWFLDEAQDTIYLLKYYKYVEEFYIPFQSNAY